MTCLVFLSSSFSPIFLLFHLFPTLLLPLLPPSLKNDLQFEGESWRLRERISGKGILFHWGQFFWGGGRGGWCTSSWERRHKWYIVYEKEQDGLEEERNKSRVEQWLSAEKASFWITDPAPERTWLVATLRVKKRVARFLLKSYPSLASLRELTPEWLPVWALTARQHCQESDSILAKILIRAHALRGPWPPVSNGSLSFPSVPYAHLLLYFLRSTYPTYCICFIF